MKAILFVAALALCAPASGAAQEVKSARADDVTFHWVEFTKFHPGKNDRASDLARKHFDPVDKEIGTKVTSIHLLTGEWDRIDIFNGRYSLETMKLYEAYVGCFAKGTYDRRQAAGSPEAHMRDAKAACRNEYDSFVASVVRDSAGSSDATSAASNARALLDQMDARAVIGPPAPAKLAQLPVERLVGAWRMGRGPLAVDMNVHFADDGSLVGILKSDFEFAVDGLRSWKVTSDGTKHAVFHASFADGRAVNYERVPSFPGEMDFINSADPAVQRFDLEIEDKDLLIRLVKPDSGKQLRFSRQIDAPQGDRSE